MDENKKPRLCELLGVEVGEKWMVESHPIVFCIAPDGELMRHTHDDTWVDAYASAWMILSVLNGKSKITRRSRWTETDMAHAKALLTLFPDATAVEKVGPYYIKIIEAISGVVVCIRAELFPGLASGEYVRLDEILEAAP
ncbi:MAG: hypothetical protein LUC39_06660 [Clostridiales bacterium]|nr:hypothetical protein [Clostridiales bacterium]